MSEISETAPAAVPANGPNRLSPGSRPHGGGAGASSCLPALLTRPWTGVRVSTIQGAKRFGGAHVTAAGRSDRAAQYPTFRRISLSAAASPWIFCRKSAFACLPVAYLASDLGAGKQKAAPKDRPNSLILLRKSGAGEGIRTLDPNLGKVVLYP